MARSRTNIRLAVGVILAGIHLDAAAAPCSSDRATPHVPDEWVGAQGKGATPSQERRPHSELWWRGEAAQTQFGIDEPRSEELEAIFQRTLPKLRTEKAEVIRMEDVLARLLANASTTNESAVVQAVEELEATRRSLSCSFTMMTYHMYLRLTPSQRAKVHAYLNHDADERAARSTSQRLF
jgi:hypothetical protein